MDLLAAADLPLLAQDRLVDDVVGRVPVVPDLLVAAENEPSLVLAVAFLGEHVAGVVDVGALVVRLVLVDEHPRVVRLDRVELRLGRLLVLRPVGLLHHLVEGERAVLGADLCCLGAHHRYEDAGDAEVVASEYELVQLRLAHVRRNMTTRLLLAGDGDADDRPLADLHLRDVGAVETTTRCELHLHVVAIVPAHIAEFLAAVALLL